MWASPKTEYKRIFVMERSGPSHDNQAQLSEKEGKISPLEALKEGCLDHEEQWGAGK